MGAITDNHNLQKITKMKEEIKMQISFTLVNGKIVTDLSPDILPVGITRSVHAIIRQMPYIFSTYGSAINRGKAEIKQIGNK